MKKSIIKDLKLQPEMLYDMYVFHIAFENGDVGKIYKKKNSIYQNIGDEVEYTINEKGSVKFVFKGQSKFNNTSNADSKYSNNNIDTQARIQWAQSVNLANEQYCNGKITKAEFLSTAKEMQSILQSIPKVESEVEQKTKIEADLPF